MTEHKLELTEDMLPDQFDVHAALLVASSEHDFLKISFELARETTHWLLLISGLVPDKSLERNTAIAWAHIVRLYKLNDAFLREFVSEKTAFQLSVVRQILETASTLSYLLSLPDESGFEAYVMDSLVAERELVKEMAANSKDRGEWLAIEERMMRSIEKSASAAGITDVSTLPSRKSIDFPNFETRIRLFGDHAYFAYRAASSEVHGTWHDLYRNHLRQDGFGFLPNLDPMTIRPHAPFAMVKIETVTLSNHLGKIIGEDVAAVFLGPLKDIFDRCELADFAHEKWLQAKFGS